MHDITLTYLTDETHGGESRDILHIISDRTGKHIRHFFFNAE